MNLEKFFKGADDHNKTLQERAFTVIPIVGLTALFLLIFIGIVVQDDIRNTIIIAACFIIFLIIVMMTKKNRKVQMGATLIAAVMVIILLPFTFIFGGSIFGGSPVWFVFGFAYIGLTVEGRRKYVLLVMGTITSAIAYYIAYQRPELVAVHTNAAAYFDSYTSVILVSLLITAMILLENRIYSSENRLIEKQKMEIEELSNTKNDFFSNVSHEIRTPLDSIVGFNELILRASKEEETLECSRNIRGASRILLTLINDLLDLSKIESGRMEIQPVEYSTVTLMADTLNLIWELAYEKGLKLVVNIAPDIPSKLWGDDIRIEQILINILGNAVKYTEEGSITFTAQCKRHDEKNVDLIFSVKDTGIGIKREMLPHIFDEFARVSGAEVKNEIGTGLGLPIAKQLTEQMNGEIRVNSIYTKGSTFSVTIPQGIRKEDSIGIVDVNKLRSAGAGDVYQQSFEAPGARVLIVDDNPMNRKATARLLRQTKMIIDEESGPRQCLERCANTHYDCIFLDQEMEDMDGIECIRQIRSQIGGLCRETPIVIVTANSSADERTRYRMAGFDGYIQKPVSGEVLENTLLRLLPSELIYKTIGANNKFAQESFRKRDKLPILITSESACDLPKEVLEKMRIPIIHFYIKNRNGSFVDDVEVDTEGVLKYMAVDGGYDLEPVIPTIDDYEAFFADHLEEADNIIHITMSSKASGSYEAAMEAAKAFDNVRIVDSESLSCGMGLLVMEAYSLLESGADVNECIDSLNRIKKNIHTSFFVNDIEYLIRKGRASRRLQSMNRIFMMRPAIIFREGRGMLFKILIGYNERAKRNYIKTALANVKSIDQRKVMMVHTGFPSDDIDDILRWIENEVMFKEVTVNKESAAMAAIHGPGAFGMAFMYHEE